MSESLTPSLPIPPGFRIYISEMVVSGTHYRREAIAELFSSGQINFDIEAEPDNKHDPNAIKVIGIKEGSIVSKRYHIGYIPKEITKKLAGKDATKILCPRLKRVWFGDSSGLEIRIDLLGPKEQYKKFFEGK